MTFIDTLKNEIDRDFPSGISELLYIYDYTGSLLFRKKWGKEIPKVYNTNDKQDCYALFGILMVVNQTLEKDEKEDIINYIFVKSVSNLAALN